MSDLPTDWPSYAAVAMVGIWLFICGLRKTKDDLRRYGAKKTGR